MNGQETDDPALRVEVLGPLRVLVDGTPVDIRGARRRTFVAVLALARSRVVSTDALIDALWPGEPPAAARPALHSLVSRVRSQLGSQGDRLEYEGHGYRLALEAHELDSAQARALAEQARAVRETDPERAADLLTAALDLWRGPALVEFGDGEAVVADAVALDELRRSLEDDLLAAELEAGRYVGLVERAARAASDDPLREARQLLHVRALAVTGRAVEALRAAQDYRRRLVEETGLDPSPELAALEARIADGLESAPATAPQREPVAPATPDVVPPPRPAGLPSFVTRLFGRDDQVDHLEQVVGDDRLLTLLGPGGVGKTRVAIELSRRLADAGRAVTFVPLSTLTSAAELPAAVSGALGIRTTLHQTTVDAIKERLARGEPVLVLDNAEHLLEPVRDLVGELLVVNDRLTIVLTSRRTTGLPMERRVAIEPLPTTRSAPGGLLESPAVQLFLDRAARVRPGFAPDEPTMGLIGEIVDHLDGVPLAIELAAGRLATLGVDDLASRLDRALDLLGDGRSTADARHRSLRSTLAWSYEFLTPTQRQLLHLLSAFADGAELAAVALAADDLGLADDGIVELAELVDASWLTAELDGAARYRMLAIVRSFAQDLGGDDARDRGADLVARWACRTAAEIDQIGQGPREPVADRRIRSELRNLRAAHHRALEAGDLDTAVAISVGLDQVASLRDLPEIWSWALELSAHPGIEGHPQGADALGAAAEAAWLRGDLDRAETEARRGLVIDATNARCQHSLATVALFRADPGRAKELWLDAAEESPVYLASSALAACYAGEAAEAEQIISRAFEVVSTGAPSNEAFCHYVAGEMAGGNDGEAVDHYERAVTLARLAGAGFVEGVATVGLAAAHARAGRTAPALDRFDRVIRYFRRTSNWTLQWTTLRNLAQLLERLGDEATAAQLVAAAAGAAEASTLPKALAKPAAPATADRLTIVDLALEAVARHRSG